MIALEKLKTKICITDTHSTKVHFFISCFLASILIALFAKVRIYLPFTPIPIVFQMQIVFLLAILLGAKKGSFSTFLFLMQGLLGYNIFAGGGLFSLTQGYLLGYMFAAFYIGKIIEKNKSYTNAFFAMMIGNIIVYTFGAIFLGLYIGYKNAILLGVLPFVLTGILKNLLVVQVLKIFNWSKQ